MAKIVTSINDHEAEKKLMSNLFPRQWLERILPSIGRTPWQVVYDYRNEQRENVGIYCALVPEGGLPHALTDDNWDLLIGEGLPGFSQHWEGGKWVTTYHNSARLVGVRPFVIVRQFGDAWPAYMEVCEEFRLFHNLAHDFDRNVLLDFDESGYEIEVVRLTNSRVEVQIRYLRQFLAATQLSLAVYFDVKRFSELRLTRGLESAAAYTHQDENSRYRLDFAKHPFPPKFKSFSRLLGKVIISAPPIGEAGKWPFTEEEEEPEDVEFVINVDEKGNPVTCTSNPKMLANYFGANPGAPHYLTPVYFRRDVLTKYFADPDRYTVSDGYLRCLGLWGVQIDNNHPTHVVVFLGDLGRDLPYSERLHWKQFNVPPAKGVSEVCFRRSFLAQLIDPEAPDLVFRLEYTRCNEAWTAVHGWPLFRPLEGSDKLLLQTVNIPATNSQVEFDNLILTLSKLLVDSLNEKAIVGAVGTGPKDEKGIAKLERFLIATKLPDTRSIIRFLRDIQALRSSGSGHRKGNEYEKVRARLKINLRRKAEAMARLLSEAAVILRALRLHYDPSQEPSA